jgi:hypothetical protein
MREIKGNIWDYHEKNSPIVIPTNGTIKRNGENVMGSGLARQAKLRFPKLPKKVGGYILEYGNEVFFCEEENLFTFPVKNEWYEEKASIFLIRKSVVSLRSMTRNDDIKIYLPLVGCGNGKLDWENDVKPILSSIFSDDKYIIIYG